MGLFFGNACAISIKEQCAKALIPGFSNTSTIWLHDAGASSTPLKKFARAFAAFLIAHLNAALAG